MSFLFSSGIMRKFGIERLRALIGLAETGLIFAGPNLLISDFPGDKFDASFDGSMSMFICSPFLTCMMHHDAVKEFVLKQH